MKKFSLVGTRKAAHLETGPSFCVDQSRTTEPHCINLLVDQIQAESQSPRVTPF